MLLFSFCGTSVVLFAAVASVGCAFTPFFSSCTCGTFACDSSDLLFISVAPFGNLMPDTGGEVTSVAPFGNFISCPFGIIVQDFLFHLPNFDHQENKLMSHQALWLYIEHLILLLFAAVYFHHQNIQDHFGR